MDKIDVLAVMDELIAIPCVECDDDQLIVDRAKVARAAVADLINAARKIKGTKHGNALLVPFEDIADFAIALARVEGR